MSDPELTTSEIGLETSKSIMDTHNKWVQKAWAKLDDLTIQRESVIKRETMNFDIGISTRNFGETILAAALANLAADTSYSEISPTQVKILAAGVAVASIDTLRVIAGMALSSKNEK